MARQSKSEPVQRVEEVDFDPAGLRAITEAMFSQLGATRLSAAVDRAQEVIFDAWECDVAAERVALAHKALEISKNCADAWNLLADETAKTLDEALDLYGKAVAAGERALGKAAFVEDVGMFWGLIETRPYMRARVNLALAQWKTGRVDEAVTGLDGMLTLNPNDNQGVRYILLNWLQKLHRDEDAAALIKRYKNDGGAEWLWPIALAAFRKSGDRAAARKALDRAMAGNSHVAAYLTGAKKLPRRLPDSVAVGSKEEAAACAVEFIPTWAGTLGALEWVRSRTGPATVRVRKSRA